MYGYELHIYADDTQIYFSIKPCSVAQEIPRLEECLRDIHQWMSANFLKLNSDKTEVILLGTRQQLVKYNIGSLSVAGVQVSLQQAPVRNLGVMFDPVMSMKAQVSSIVKSTIFHIRNVARIRRYLTLDSAKKLVNSLITSRLDYCNSLLAGVAGGQLDRLQCVQNSSARVVLQLPKFSSPSLDSLHWLPIRYRIQFKTAVIVYKSLRDLGPSYLRDLLTLYHPNRTLRSVEDCWKLAVPRAKLPTAGDRAFQVNGPTTWNKIPLHIRASDDLNSFKKALKTFYYKQAFNSFNVKRPRAIWEGSAI